MNPKFVLNDFELELSKTDERLLIQAKNLKTGAEFSKTITQGVAKALSQEHNLDINMVFELLKDFFESKPEQASLSLTEDGVLSYSCVIMYGKLSNKLAFNIELEKDNLDPVGKLEEQITKLKKRVSELEQVCEKKLEKVNDERYQALEKLVVEKFEKLETMFLKVNERLQVLEEKVKTGPVQQNINEEIEWTFDHTGTFESDYKLGANNRSAISKINTSSQICGLQALPKSGKFKFTLLIEGVENNAGYIFAGIVPHTARFRRDSYFDQASFGLTHHGFFWKEGKGTTGYAKFRKGDQVSFIVDMNLAQATISINNRECCKHILSKEDIEKYEFYPCIITGGNKAGVGATFVY